MTSFLDAGAHDGASIRMWRRLYGDGPILAIEPNPAHAATLRSLGVRHLLAALGPGTIRPFYLGAHDTGCSLVAEKWTGHLDRDNPLYVQTVRLADALKLLPAGDVVVKMDIEGAEYDVLEGALDDDALDSVRELYVDFHGDRITGLSRQRHNALVTALLARGYSLPKWDPGTGEVRPYGSRWLMEEK